MFIRRLILASFLITHSFYVFCKRWIHGRREERRSPVDQKVLLDPEALGAAVAVEAVVRPP